MVLLRNFLNMFNIPELRKKILFTLGILVVYRLGNHIPLIGVDIDNLLQMMSQGTGLSGFFSYLDLFSGGNLRQCTIFALGISPYITASIMMQFLSLSIPFLEQLSKEGEYGRKIINQYTRYLAIIVAITQSSGLMIVLERYGLVIDPWMGSRILFVISLTVGTVFVMWLAEQISLFGIGNGTSMIIFAGIVARFPDDIIKVLGGVHEGMIDPMIGVLLFATTLVIAGAIVFLEKGDRKIPVQYSRRVVGNKTYGGQSTYIPFKINPTGVMPVILASAMLNIPVFALTLLSARWPYFKAMSEGFAAGGLLHGALDFVLIIAFSFFYAALVFNPEELADNIKKGGGFIPGIRPGRQTADFFSHVLTRIGLVGALYLASLALIPSLIHWSLSMPFYLSGILSGTALLIVVGVANETAAQIESYLIEHRYEGFLASGRLRSRGGR